MHNYKLFNIDLQLFNDGAAAAAPAGEATQAVENTPKAETKAPGSSRRGKSGDNIVYGIQEDAPESTAPAAGETKDKGVSKSGVSTTSDSLEAKRSAFKDLISGEYKEQYTEETQRIINNRFKEAKGMEQTIAAQKPILDMLMQRYQIADGDMSKLQTAIEQDDRYWEEAADEAGLTVEQYKAMQKLERENAELKAIRQKQQAEQMGQQKLNQWYAEAEEVKKMYPTFDLRTEAGNRDFMGLLKSGLSVQKAYEVVHMDEIKESAAKAAAQTAGEQMKARIQARASRPSENGTSSQGAVIVKNDVHSLSRADRAEIARRAQRGDKIRF
jgi:hypothetical protein